MDFDLEGLEESDMEDFCFPEDCILDPARDLASLVGNADDAHPELSSPQTLAASLRGVGKRRKHHKQLSNSNQEKNVRRLPSKDLGKETLAFIDSLIETVISIL